MPHLGRFVLTIWLTAALGKLVSEARWGLGAATIVILVASDEARSHFQRAIALNPNHPKSILALASFHLSEQHVVEAPAGGSENASKPPRDDETRAGGLSIISSVLPTLTGGVRWVFLIDEEMLACPFGQRTSALLTLLACLDEPSPRKCHSSMSRWR